MAFPVHRLRRLRSKEPFRRMIRETRLGVADLIYPLFVVGEDDVKARIKQIPGSFYLSGKHLVDEAHKIVDLGIPAVLLFGIPTEGQKDEMASMSHSPDGPVQKALKLLCRAAPGLVVITDLCLCEYTRNGQCGVLKNNRVDNDATLEIIQKASLSLARAGAGVIAPSGMMDGVTGAIRDCLDDHGFQSTLVMPYSAKFSSKLYGPFKEGTRSRPQKALHQTHQLDIANGNEALREVELDVEEGADAVIVKPALPCLDIISRIKRELNIPIAAYSVSGEHGMLLAGCEKNLFGGEEIMMEMLTCIKRAGADMIISYFAKNAALKIAKG